MINSSQRFNPFEFDTANNLTDEMIVDFYIDDFNYSRFIQSKRNVFLIGERGSGKTMALLYNQWKLQDLKAEKDGASPTLDMIGVYVPCNTPLTHRADFQLLDDFQGAAISEHFLVLSIAHAIADTLGDLSRLLSDSNSLPLKNVLEFVLGGKIPDSEDVWFIRLMRT